jgi:hypothetical protein
MDKLSLPIQVLADLLSLEEVITPSSELYIELTRTWAAQKNLKPRLVVGPKDLTSLSRVIAYLGTSDLETQTGNSHFSSMTPTEKSMEGVLQDSSGPSTSRAQLRRLHP